MTIGIPRAMLYYRYRILWETFFKLINCEVLISEETNRKTLHEGIKYSIDECCLPVKIYMGHVCSLIGRCDYILVPRIISQCDKNDVCVKLNALYDIVQSTFENIQTLDYNIDALHHETEYKAFIRLGTRLGNSRLKSRLAYLTARKRQNEYDNRAYTEQQNSLKSTDKPKILIVSHPYNSYDRLIGQPITDYITRLGCVPVFADITDKKESVKKSKELSQSMYWLYNKELVGSLQLLSKNIDGIIILTAFPCGPDSLTSELILRKATDKPTINIILDELSGDAGIQTRIESFLDIISARIMCR